MDTWRSARWLGS